MKINGKTVVDEMCRCGHLKSVHDVVQFGESQLERDEECGHIVGRVVKDFEEQTTIKGHGACTLCPCPKFTWTRFVFNEDSSSCP